MAVNWPEIGLLVLFNVVLLSVAMLYVRYRAFPKALVVAEQWIGGAIGRFMQSLSEQAVSEEGGPGAPGGAGGGGALNIGGFKIDAGTLRSIAEILKLLQEFGGVGGLLGGLTGGGGAGGGKIGL